MLECGISFSSSYYRGYFEEEYTKIKAHLAKKDLITNQKKRKNNAGTTTNGRRTSIKMQQQRKFASSSS